MITLTSYRVFSIFECWFTVGDRSLELPGVKIDFQLQVFIYMQVDVTYMNGKPAENINVEIDAKTSSGSVVLERVVDGKAAGDVTNQLGHGSFIVDVPKTFDIAYLDVKVCFQCFFIVSLYGNVVIYFIRCLFITWLVFILQVLAKINKAGKDLVCEGRFQPTMYKSNGKNYLFVRFLNKPRVSQSFRFLRDFSDHLYWTKKLCLRPYSCLQVGESVDAEAFVLSAGRPSSLTYLVRILYTITHMNCLK